MSGLDFEKEYNNRARVPESPRIMAGWAKAAASARAELACELGLSYGLGERCLYDLFLPTSGASQAPLAVYVHGGYWQRGDRGDYSFVARALVAEGLKVALPSYSLCPAVGVMDIVGELRLFVAALWRRFGQRVVVSGHSAGGQIAAAMLATDWRGLDPALPADLVPAAYSLSGVFALEPLIPTSLNEALALTPDSARAASPILWAPPAAGRVLVASVGGEESQEFLRQSMDMAAAWSAADVTAECVVVPGANHFTIVDELTRPTSAMVHRLVRLAREYGR